MTGDREAILDASAVVAVALLVLAARSHLLVMSIGVALVCLLRIAAFTRVRDAALFVACGVIGYANDWNTVVRHGVYAYGPPSDLAPWSTIPAWMFGYWALIFRLVITLGTWSRLGPTGEEVRGTRVHPALRVSFLLALVLATRLCIFRLFQHPIASFVPFALALGLHAVVMPWGPRERRLVLLAVTVGPIAEAILIGAGLHHYRLGVLLGVPIWIALWWALGALVLAELGRRAQRA